jgi:HJR/Mrr/RecB family endonuclease
MREHFDPDWKAKVLGQTQKQSPVTKAKLDKMQEKEDFIKGAMNRIADTPDGLFYFRWLMKELGFKESTMTMKQTGDAAKDIILCKEAQRNIWQHLRKKFTVQVRNRIEEDTDES